MRHLLVVLLAACGGSAGAASTTATTPTAPLAAATTAASATAAIAPPAAAAPPVGTTAAAGPGLPTFARAGELYLLTVDPAPTCEAWTIDPAAATLQSTATRGPKTITRTIGYRVDGQTLILGETSHVERVGDEVVGDESSTSCGEEPMVEGLDALELASGARWFRSRIACDAALASHARVATELCLPLEIDRAYFEPHQPTRRRFQRLLARGGAAFMPVETDRGRTCKVVHVRPGRAPGPGFLAGRFDWRIVTGDGVRGVESVGFRLDTRAEDHRRSGAAASYGPMALFGSGATFEDGSGYGMGCLDFTTPIYRDGVVELAGPMYFTARACRAAVARQDQRDAWLPPLPDDDSLDDSEDPAAPADPDDPAATDDVAMDADGSPAIGGC